MPVQLKRHRFTVDEYHRMARVGILGEDDRVELIDGEIVEMAPIGSDHSETVDELAERFVLGFADVARVRIQSPIRLSAYEEPQPDLALLRRRADSYRLIHPTPDDVLLVIEVADTPLATDRSIKVPLYRRAGIPEVWLLDLQHHVVYVYREPTTDGYRVTQTIRRGERIAPLVFPEREIVVDDLLV